MTTPDRISDPWNGDPAFLVTEALSILRMSPTDPDATRLNRLADAVVRLVRNHLDRDTLADLDGIVPDPVTNACVDALVEAYRRKDIPFGVSAAYSAEGDPIRVSRDWLRGVEFELEPYRQKWGIA